MRIQDLIEAYNFTNFTFKSGDKYGAKFKTPEGEFDVTAELSNPDINEWTVTFEKDRGFNITGDASNPKAVMSTIYDFIKRFAKAESPDAITFGAAKREMDPKTKELVDTGRASLYSAMTKRFAGQIGYNVETMDGGEDIIFYLTKKRGE